jgi:hypothetical protein
MTDKNLNECRDLGPERPFNLDDPPPFCAADSCPPQEPSLEGVHSFFDDLIHDKTGIGAQANCDPMQTGQIINDLAKSPHRNTIYRYSKAIRGCDEAMMDMFRNLVVIDEQGVAHPVPIIWATQERAVAAVVQENVRKDPSLVVDRVKLPTMSIYSSDFSFNLSRYTYHQALNYFRCKSNKKPGLLSREKRNFDTVFGYARGIPIDIGYTLTMWTYFVEDMNQILEQVVLKFSPIAYIRVQGVQWETIVKIDSIGNNIDTDPGNTSNRLVKFQVHMTAETYVPQPIDRQKTVLDTRIAFTNSLNDEEITEVIARLEESVDELEI